jgi:hypothetical protein
MAEVLRGRVFLRTISGCQHRPSDRQLEWPSIAERVLLAGDSVRSGHQRASARTLANAGSTPGRLPRPAHFWPSFDPSVCCGSAAGTAP